MVLCSNYECDSKVDLKEFCWQLLLMQQQVLCIIDG